MNFEEISIRHKEDFQRHVFHRNLGLCEFAFVNLFSLKEKYGTQILFDDGFMYIRQIAKGNNNYAYFCPLGDGDLKAAIERIEADARANGRGFTFWGLTENMKNRIGELMPGKFEFKTDRDWAEYVYLSERLINLNGSDLKKRRNNLNLFLNKYGDRYTFEPITAKNINEAWDYHNRWFDENVDKNTDAESLIAENKIIRVAFDNWDGLGLVGGMVKIDGETLGYTYGSPISENMFDVHVEKADFTRNGIYQAINRDFAKHACEGYKYVNREEDLGIEGLRTAKTAYKPEMLNFKYMGCYR